MQMNVETLFRLVSLVTLDDIVRDVEEATGHTSITATEVRYKADAERSRRLDQKD